MYLVIGGNGFLGGEIVSQLVERGDAVRVLTRRSVESGVSGVEYILGDVRDSGSLLAACRGVDAVFHTASIPSISVDWQPFYETNVLGAKNVIDACKACGVRRLIYTSSASVTFDCKSQPAADEKLNYPKRWMAHYPHSKAIAEKLVLDAAGKSDVSGKSDATDKSDVLGKSDAADKSDISGKSDAVGLLTCSIRPHLIIGIRDRHLIPRLLDRARRGKLFRVGDGMNLVDIIFVENAAAGHIQAADALKDESSPVNGNSYFISQGEPVNCWDWIDEVLAACGLPKVTKSISFNKAWLLGTVLEAWYKIVRLQGEPLMTRFLAAQLAQTHYLNIEKAKKDFNYKPIISMTEGMEKLKKWLKKNYT
ncbi:MAG: NAD-dependent epimerase/dehydratase family protein [Planctomycetaceae bacterium]|jgi:nucleoside-diphosphate-sugar epimerase|nr:NAD-dependent epimerase/dehydratase family protein [Planctomycetaceae bacterium]